MADAGDHTEKLRIGGNGVLLSIIVAVGAFYFGAPLIVLALPIVVFEALAWKLLIVDRDEFDHWFQKMFPARSTAFGFAHFIFYALWGWIYDIALAFHPNPDYIKNYFIPWFVFLFLGMFYAILIIQYQFGSENKVPRFRLTITRAAISVFRIPFLLAMMGLDLLATVYLIAYFTIGHIESFPVLNLAELMAYGVLLIVVTFIDAALYGLLERDDESSTSDRLGHAIEVGKRWTIINLAGIILMVTSVSLHINLLSNEILPPETTWLILFVIDIVLPLIAVAIRTPRLITPSNYQLVRGELIIGYVGLGAIVFLVSCLATELPFLSPEANGLIDLSAILYLAVIFVVQFALVIRGWREIGEVSFPYPSDK